MFRFVFFTFQMHITEGKIIIVLLFVIHEFRKKEKEISGVLVALAVGEDTNTNKEEAKRKITSKK